MVKIDNIGLDGFLGVTHAIDRLVPNQTSLAISFITGKMFLREIFLF
jgi:hypothetical protein